MNSRKFTKLVFTILFILAMGSSARLMAEDIEVYVGSNQITSVRPNIVFIIDTSGSMNTDVTLTTASYDPTHTYTDGGCSSDRVYWSSRGNPPDCSTDNYILKTSFTCDDASGPLFGTSGSGFYVGRAARYRNRWWEDRWDDLNDRNHDDFVECEADWGVHGQSDATDPYPADEGSGGPWRADNTNAINWSSTGSTYTFYSANYLNYLATPGTTTTKTRLEIVQEVFSELMDSISNVNIAVMRFDDKSQELNKGGYFIMPMQQLTTTNRANYKTAVNNLSPGGYTPLSETMYEAYQYYRGGQVYFGDDTSPGTNHTDVLDPTDTTKYKTPVEYQCQKNFVILLTDGDPSYDTDANTLIQSLPDFSAVTGSSSCSGNCLDELSKVMYETDCNGDFLATQNVITYTIGFATDQTLLSSAASNGGGSYYTADDTAGLTDAFTAIITDILAINTTFTAPAVSVNAFNRSYHNEELYYALFRPSARPKWTGNIKRYKYWNGGTAGDPAGLRDVNNALAVDPNTGFTYPTSRSWWTLDADAPDGDKVGKGGAAGMLTNTRNTYTYTGTNTSLTDSSNALSVANAETQSGAITKAMMGNASMSDADLEDMLNWIHGIDVLDDDSDNSVTDARRFMADPLHAQPVLITYGGSSSTPDITLFAATNEGYLHAVNTSDGSEYFAFMPKELLPNIATLFDDASSVAHPYGLDGPLTYWFNDKNDNGVLYAPSSTTPETDEFIYLYQGMRRGGNSYYALDVTNRSSPVFKWQITGGTTGFEELAQTWSAMTKGKIKLNGTTIDVVIFGGGYDVGQDANSTAADDSEGRAIYIVNASTGAKIWEAGPSSSASTSVNLTLNDMTNSIPSDIKVLDTNGDGYSDRMYVGDMRGQIWRFDIDNTANTADALVTGGVIARLGDATTAGNRRFYYTPQVVLSQDRAYYAVVIGSGYRSHPLNKDIHDAFFVIRDPNLDPPTSYDYVDSDDDGTPDSKITMSDLYDATLNTIANTASTADQVLAANTSLGTKQGWYFWLNEGDPATSSTFIGEKVTATPLVLNNTIMFTTFTPVESAAAATTTSCAPNQGRALLYHVNLNDASNVQDYNENGTSERDDRIAGEPTGGSLPSTPVPIYPPDSSECPSGIVICVGLDCKCSELKRTPKKERWYQE